MRIPNIVDSFYAESDQLNKKQRIFFYVISLFAAGFLYTMYLITIRYNFDFSFDEPFYLSICERLLRGDRLIVDEWALPQFTAIFQFLPYALFKMVTGSTEGVVLFMRYVYLTTNFLFFWYIFFRYRNRPWVALTTAFLFSSFIPLGAFLFGYYYLPLIFLFSFATIITDETTRFRSARLVFAGILLSCTVILNPGTALLWLVYFVFVLIRFVEAKKGKRTFSNYDFLLNVKTFRCLLWGVLISAAAFISYCLSCCGLKNILQSLSHLVPNHNGQKAQSILSLAYVIDHIQVLLRDYGLFFWFMLLLTAAIVFFRVIERKTTNSKAIRKLLFVINTSVFVLANLWFYIRASKSGHPILMEPPVFIAWFGLNCFLLCEKPDPKMLFFWLVGATLTLTQDLISEVTYGFGLIISVFPSVCILCQSLHTFYSVEPQHRKKSSKKAKVQDRNQSARFIIFTLLLFGMLSWSVINVVAFSHWFRSRPVEEKRIVLSEGPYKNLSMPESYAIKYNHLISDLELAKNLTDAPIYITGIYPVGYLFLDRDIVVASTGDSETSELINEEYWQLYPEKRPKVVYVPVAEKLSLIKITPEEFARMPEEQFVDFGWFEGRAIKGKDGLIVQVFKWKELPSSVKGQIAD